MPLRSLPLILVAVFFCGCAEPTATGRDASVLRLAVTTSTRDSGLLDALIPVFEDRYPVRVDVIAVGSGAALKLGERGDVDAVLVHARSAEDAFMNAGHGIRREDVMYNDFLIAGPALDPAGVRMLSPTEAMRRIAARGMPFVSRGDDSGTHQRELALWKRCGGVPGGEWYLQSGQGMGPALTMADELQAYVLTDRGTYVRLRSRISLVPLVEESDLLKNPYGVIVVNPSRHEDLNIEMAHAFADFLVSAETQRLIRDFRVQGETLFHPARVDGVAGGDRRE